jgi:hypothetical protein
MGKTSRLSPVLSSSVAYIRARSEACTLQVAPLSVIHNEIYFTIRALHTTIWYGKERKWSAKQSTKCGTRRRRLT